MNAKTDLEMQAKRSTEARLTRFAIYNARSGRFDLVSATSGIAYPTQQLIQKAATPLPRINCCQAASQGGRLLAPSLGHGGGATAAALAALGAHTTHPARTRVPGLSGHQIDHAGWVRAGALAVRPALLARRPQQEHVDEVDEDGATTRACPAVLRFLASSAAGFCRALNSVLVFARPSRRSATLGGFRLRAHPTARCLDYWLV